MSENIPDERPEEKIWGADLGLFSSGLFNFYQFADFEVKENFLELIEKYFLKLERELHMCLSGFIVCMLPAFEDQNSQILKRVERIFKRTEEIVGTSTFFGAIWMSMLRTPRTRLAGIKFLEKNIPKSLAMVDR
jgi:hypothetical protein